MSFITPIAPQSNPPINPQYFFPRRQVITAISMGLTTVVTTLDDMNYPVGQEVRLIIPAFNGAQGLNEQTGFVITSPAPNQVILTIDSQMIEPFTPVTGFISPQIIPIGDVNNGVVNSNGRTSNGTFIPGSFINISPA